ncbi:helix-turn-helix domain-containing protein [Shinella sp. BYT-45]|uniref:helix-turn-helix domain-containing protein n=1 Tax=Shinella sp. BYT-45 TaxID=3377377 RepID=UPI00397F123B
MSHDATNWAVKVRGISCTEARVLWHLADCHNPVFGCYPKQDYLADACEIDVRSIRRALDSLRAKGLINWTEHREGRNRKANRYSLAFEDGFRRHEGPEDGEAQPDKLSGSPEASTGQECHVEPDKSDGLNRTPESSIEPVREPVRETGKEREGAGARSGQGRKVETRAALVKRVQKFLAGVGYEQGEWKGWSASTINYIVQQFAALSPEEQDRACAWRDRFLERARGAVPMPPGNYFRDRAWQMLEMLDEAAITKAAASAASPTEKVPAPPFGPVFGAVRAWLCLQGPDDSRVPLDVRDPVIRHFHGLAQQGLHPLARSYLSRRGISLTAAGEFVFPDGFDAEERRRRLSESGFPEVNALHEKAKIHQPAAVASRFLPLKDLCEPVPVESVTFAQWLAHDERVGWPRLPDPGRMSVVWFPKGGPEALPAFDAAARELLEAGRSDAAE